MELGRSKSACFLLQILFCFAHVYTNMGPYVGAHNIKEILIFCSFWDRTEPFPKKTHCSHTVKLCYYCGKTHCSRWSMFNFWASGDPLNTPHLILGVPRENRAGYWWWFIILWKGTARNRKQTGKYPLSLGVHSTALRQLWAFNAKVTGTHVIFPLPYPSHKLTRTEIRLLFIRMGQFLSLTHPKQLSSCTEPRDCSHALFADMTATNYLGCLVKRSAGQCKRQSFCGPRHQ